MHRHLRASSDSSGVPSGYAVEGYLAEAACNLSDAGRRLGQVHARAGGRADLARLTLVLAQVAHQGGDVLQQLLVLHEELVSTGLELEIQESLAGGDTTFFLFESNFMG